MIDQRGDEKQLCKFLVKAKKSTYAAGDKADKIIEDDKSTSLFFEEGNWKYHDNYIGGEPYGGRELVFFQGKPVYIMVYYGWVAQSVADPASVYKILQKALSLIPEDKPFRGPEECKNEDLLYVNTVKGVVSNFFGEEVISRGNKELYRAKYMGGLVDQRK